MRRLGDLKVGYLHERITTDVYVRHAIASHWKVCSESNDSACFAGFWLRPKGSREPMLLDNGGKRMYWLVPRPVVKDCGNSALGISTNDERRGRLLVRLLTRNHGNRLQLFCWLTWCKKSAVESLT